MKTPWELVEVRGAYRIWRSPWGTYQATRGATPPDTTAGYYNLQTLLKLKGLASN